MRRLRGRPRGFSGRPLNVLCLLDSIEIELGGAEKLAVEMIAGLDPQRYRRTLCLTRSSELASAREPARSIIDRLERDGVEVISLRRSSRIAVRPWARLVRELRSRRIDILHAHKFGSNLWGVIFGRLARVPIVVAHEHMWSFTGGRARNLIDRELIARFADAFIAVSEITRTQMIERQGIRPEDVIYIPNGVPELPPSERTAARHSLGLAAEDPVIGTLANLRPEKALDVLVRATAELRRQFPRLRCLIAGEGPERERLERLIAELGLGEGVTLLGYRRDVPDLLAALDIAVCCSDYEGGPLSVMEYMDAGLPIVATRVGGLPELIEDGRSGRFVPPRDPIALAATTADLIEDPDQRRRLGEGARAVRRQRFGIDGWVRQIEQLYERLVADRLATGPATSPQSRT